MIPFSHHLHLYLLLSQKNLKKLNQLHHSMKVDHHWWKQFVMLVGNQNCVQFQQQTRKCLQQRRSLSKNHHQWISWATFIKNSACVEKELPVRRKRRRKNQNQWWQTSVLEFRRHQRKSSIVMTAIQRQVTMTIGLNDFLHSHTEPCFYQLNK